MADGRAKPKKFHVDRDWFIRVYYEDMLPTRDIAAAIGCCNEHVNAIAKKFGITVRPRLKRSIFKEKAKIDMESVVYDYFELKMSSEEIGRKQGVSSSCILRRLAADGYKVRHHNDTKRGAPARNKKYLDTDLVISMYSEKYASAKTVGDHFGVSRQVILRILSENGIPKKPMGETRDFNKENHPLWRHDLTNEERQKRRDIVAHEKWRDLVYERDSYKCQCCHDDKGGNLNAHHIIPHSQNRDIAWDVSNGITLCKGCHIRFHKQYGYTKCTKDDLAEYLRMYSGN